MRVSARLLFFLLVYAASGAGCTPSQTVITAKAPLPSGTLPSDTIVPSPTGAPTVTPILTQTATPLPTATATPEPTATPTPVVLIGAGDIAYCGEDHLGDEQTALLLEGYPEAVIFTAGDNVQGIGTRAEYRNCFGPTWGRFIDRLHPIPGNHDYLTEGGLPYFEYFGQIAGLASLGYYSYNLGEWHIVALNSNCDDIACGADSRQAAWLREDLANSSNMCTLIYWHHPRWSSGLAGNYGSVWTFWRISVEYGVELAVNGHDHDYERFAPMDGEGQPDPNGVRQFVVGTGGTPLREFGEVKPNSEIRYNETYGLLIFRLSPGQYSWEFLPVSGDFSDSGTGTCH